MVDDDADVRWTVAEILRSAGFSVAEAPKTARSALELLRTAQYRMVLLDLRMPKRDGVSLIEAAGTYRPVIVHSAYSLDAEDRERLGSRVVDYLHKPVSPQKLLRAVEAVLGSQHGRDRALSKISASAGNVVVSYRRDRPAVIVKHSSASRHLRPHGYHCSSE